jgi:prepilin-type N-terminal cleavage/methylation domain-containing protein
MNVQKQKKGFTIIEVVLVLAIAGLIFLMVFIALPALQRGQKDSQRDQDLSRAQTAIQSYQKNNRNNLPAAADMGTFATNYLKVGGETFVDPSGKDYAFTSETSTGALTGDKATSDATKAGQTTVRIFFTNGATCGDGGALNAGQGNRKIAFRLALEGGGIACRSN